MKKKLTGNQHIYYFNKIIMKDENNYVKVKVVQSNNEEYQSTK